MALSNDLINQFVKLTNQEEKPKETTVNGTYKVVNGEEFVQLDGSEIWTPVTSTVEAETGERVKVTIKNHTATVTSNISSPSARSKSVQDLKDEVDEYGNTIQQLDNSIQQQGNSISQINNNIQQVENTITQHGNAISQHDNDIQQINNNISQQGNDITQINNTITQQGNDIDQLNNTVTQHGNTLTQHGNTITQQGNTITQQGNTISQQGNTITQQGNTIAEHNTAITTANSNIQILNSGFVINNGVLTGLSQIVVDDLETQHLDATYANIDFANINAAAVRKVFSDSGIIKDLVVQQGKITGELVGVTIKGDLIEGNTIKAEKLVVRGEDGLYYKLNLDGMDNISTTQASKFTLLTETPSDWSTNYTDYYTVSNNKYVHVSGNSAPTWATNTYYKLNSEHQNGLDGTVIIAKSITADKVQVSDLVAFDATIGGFHIGDHSLYSGVKSSVSNTTRGIYMDDSGQFNIGDSNNFIKYFLDTSDNTYKLNISAGVIHMGGSNKTLQQTIDEIEESMDNIEIGGRNLLKGTAGTAIILSNSTLNYSKAWQYGLWYTPSGGNGIPKIESVSDSPISNIDKAFVIRNATTGNCDFAQRNIPKTNSVGNTQYTFSVWCKGTGTLLFRKIINDGSNVQNILQKSVTYNTWTKEKVTFTEGILHGIQFGTTGACTEMKFVGPKLESGNKATDWSPAPEDNEGEVGTRNYIEGTSDEWRSLNLTNSTNQTLHFENVTDMSTKGLNPGDILRISLYVKFSSDIAYSGDGTKNNVIQGTRNSGGTWTNIIWNGGQCESQLEDIMASDSKEGYIYTFIILPNDFNNGTYNEKYDLSLRFDYYTGIVYAKKLMVCKGDKYTDWNPAPEDTDAAIERVEVGGRNLLQYTAYDKTTSDGITVRGSYCTLTIVSDDKPNGVKNKTLKMVTGGSAVSGTKDIWQKCWNLQIYGKSLKLSLYVKGSVAAKMFIRLAGSYSSKSSANFQYDVTTSWKKLEIDLGTVTNDISSGESEIIYGFNTAGTFYINSMKMEYGDKYTDWTPAPEDVDASIAKTVKTVDVEYYLSTSSSSATGGSWSTTAPAWADGKYMWSRQKVTYVDNTTATRNATCIAGATGNTGGTGATGTGIDSITEEYYLSSSKSTQSDGSWVTTPPTWSSGKYIWTRSKIVYKNPASTAYTTPICSSEWEAVNEIDVGGRNLLIGTKTQDTSKSNQRNSVTLTEDTYMGCNVYKSNIAWADIGFSFDRLMTNNTVKPGDILTYSIYVKSDDDTVRNLGFYMSTRVNGQTKYYYAGAKPSSIYGNTIKNGYGWVKFHYTFEVLESMFTDVKEIPISTRIECTTGTNTDKWIYFAAPKLEFGNKPTDWTPAPEDVDDAISDVSKSISEVIVGTQTASTGSWTGVASFDSLSDGQQITYWLPYAGSGNATLNLTLSNGTTTGAIPCYYQGASRLTTHYPAGSVIHLTYRVNANVNGTNYTGWWGDANYDSNNTNLLRFQQKIKVLEAISAGQIITGTSTGYKKLAVNVSFDLDKPILVASSTLVANATGDNNYIVRPDVNIRTTNGNGSWTATQYEVLYLVGTISGNTFTPTSPFLTTTKPTSESNLYYISLGYMYSTYQIILYPEHPIFKYVDGQFKNISQIAYEAKYDIDNLEIGAQNLIHKTQSFTGNVSSNVTSTLLEETYNQCYVRQSDLSASTSGTGDIIKYMNIRSNEDIDFKAGEVYTLSFWIKIVSYTTTHGQYIQSYFHGNSGYATVRRLDSTIDHTIGSYNDGNTNQYNSSLLDGEWHRLYVTWEIKPNATAETIAIDKHIIVCRLGYGLNAKICGVKFEKGNKPTDWSANIDDINTDIGDAKSIALGASSEASTAKSIANQASIDINTIKGYIQNLVVDENGQSMMTQIGSGWAFNMGSINSNLNSLSEAVGNIEDNNQVTQDLLNNVKTLAESVADKTAYINVDYTTDGSGNPIPRMILGAQTSAFKIRITNESIDFMESDTVMAYATSNTFYNLTTVVQKELQIGSGPSYIWSVRANGNMGLTYKSNGATS